VIVFTGMDIAGSDPDKLLFLCIMLSKIWAKKGFAGTFLGQKVVFKDLLHLLENRWHIYGEHF
jgi:hypothetical protein